MFAWCCGPWLVRAGARHLMLISPPGDIAALSRHPGDVYVRFCWVQLSGARVRDCREIAASSVTDLWMALEFDQVSNKWTDFIRRLSQNYFIWRVNSQHSKFLSEQWWEEEWHPCVMRLPSLWQGSWCYDNEWCIFWEPGISIASVGSSCRCHIRAAVNS